MSELDDILARRARGSLTVTPEEAKKYQKELGLPDAALGTPQNDTAPTEEPVEEGD